MAAADSALRSAILRFDGERSAVIEPRAEASGRPVVAVLVGDAKRLVSLALTPTEARGLAANLKLAACHAEALAQTQLRSHG